MLKHDGLVFIEWQTVQEKREALRAQAKRLAFTNGVFDLLHVGHLRYLKEAASLADVLWVGLNSDESVRQLKGPLRPIMPWAERAELLAALSPVDAVVFFNETTADNVLHLIQPDLYVKGGDYTIATLPEAPTARALGSEIKILPFVKGRSTTDIVQLVRQKYKNS